MLFKFQHLGPKSEKYAIIDTKDKIKTINWRPIQDLFKYIYFSISFSNKTGINFDLSIGSKGPRSKEVYIELGMTLIDNPKSNMHLTIIDFPIVHGIAKIQGLSVLMEIFFE